MCIADMLSRAYLQADHNQHESIPEYQVFQLSQEQLLFQEIADINKTPLSAFIRRHSSADQTVYNWRCHITKSHEHDLFWPLTKEEEPVCIREYWNYKEELTVQDGVLHKGMKVIVPAFMRPQMIARTRSSHLGPDACVTAST